MTKLFVGACTLVFAFQTLGAGELSWFGGKTSEVLRWGGLSPVLGVREPWRLLSATFVHFGILHLVFNMLGTVDLGRLLEPQLGSARFLVTLLFTAVAGFLVSQLWYLEISPSNTLTGGASGGLFGLVGTLIGTLYARGNPAWKQIAVRFGVYAVLFAVVLPVNNAAHAGGFLAGLPLGYLFYKESRPWRRHRLFRWCAGIGLVLSVGSVTASHLSDVWKVERAREILRQGRIP